MNILKAICNFFGNLLFPPRCVHCDERIDWYPPWEEKKPVCKECEKQLKEQMNYACGVCGKPIHKCHCVNRNLYDAKIQHFLKMAYYQSGKGTVPDSIVYFLKKLNNHPCADFCAEFLSEQVESLNLPKEDCLFTWLPRSRTSFLKHGHDQAELLAKALAKKTGICAKRLLVRNKKLSMPQKGMTILQRQHNAQISFLVNKRKEKKIKGKHIFLVDDIITSGFSMHYGAKKLYGKGALSVTAVAIASNISNRDRAIMPPEEQIDAIQNKKTS